MSIVEDFQKKELEKEQAKTDLMEMMVEDFSKTVFAEFLLKGTLVQAFENMSFLHFQFFGFFPFSSYKKFIESLK